MKTYYFNIVLALLASFLIIMQEVWLSTSMTFVENFALGGLAAIGFSFCAEMLKMLFFDKEGNYSFSLKNLTIGSCAGIILALVLSIIL